MYYLYFDGPAAGLPQENIYKVFPVVNVHVLDEKNIPILDVHFRNNELLDQLYEQVERTGANFTCITHKGYNLRGDFRFIEYRLETGQVVFTLDHDNCSKIVSPPEFLAETQQGTSKRPTDILDYYDDDDEGGGSMYKKLLFLTIAMVVLFCVLCSMLYYIKTLKKAQLLENAREQLREGKFVPSASTSTDTSLRSTKEKTAMVSYVVFDSERAKIEEDETGTSSAEVKEIKQIPSDQAIQ
ncbi:hypothetical protein Q1695_013231 [Nippostrongylus brasiliensis]|nr:hypothetical protein Q1695_013231 [Nippostrongylus brasiliensis]